MTPEVLDSLKEILLMGQVAALQIEEELPDEVHHHKFIASRHSPAPWELTYHYYRNHECSALVLNALHVRSEIAEVVEKLNKCIKQIEAEGKPINTKLARTRRAS